MGIFDDLKDKLAADQDRRQAAKLNRMAGSDPRSARSEIDELRYFLNHDDDAVRRQASQALAQLSVEFPGDVKNTTGRIREVLFDDDLDVQLSAITTLTNVATEYPTEVKGFISKANLKFDHEDEDFREQLALVNQKLAVDQPQELTNEVTILKEQVDDKSAAVREKICSALGLIAVEYPEQVEEAIPELTKALSDDDPSVREAAAFALGMVAEGSPESVNSAVSPLVNLLEDSDPEVRKAAIKTLATVGAEQAVPMVEDLQENDPNQEVRETATEALDKWQAQSQPKHESQTDPPVFTQAPDTIPTTPGLSVEYDEIHKETKIGSGGNADVYRSKIRSSGKGTTIGLKEPHIESTLQSGEVDRLINEAKNWAKLDDHDHIVDIVDYGAEPLPWIAMEYMDGGNLNKQVNNMMFEQKLWTAIKITNAVRYAHKHGVVHLDLKPENILFTTVEDGWAIPKIADWGLSKHLLNHSKTRDALSPQYAAPEQFDKDAFGDRDNITDIYQLGAIFYTLFTNQQPFEGQAFEVMHQVKHEEPTPPSNVADVPPALDDIIQTAMATEKDDRYEDVLLLRNTLQSLC